MALSNDVASTYVNNYFSTIGRTLTVEIGDLTPNAFLNGLQLTNFLLLDRLNLDAFTIDEVISEIKNINIYKSSGITNISSRILKDIS